MSGIYRQRQVHERWYCFRCKEHGPWYEADDLTIRAGWSVHELNCTGGMGFGVRSLDTPTTSR